MRFTRALGPGAEEMSFLVRLPIEQYPADAIDGLAPGAFGLGNARAAAWLSQLAYEDDEAKIDTVARQWQFQRLASFRPVAATNPTMPRTIGFVLNGRDTHVVAFSGTDPLIVAHWITDFDFAVNGQGIHRGFGIALDAVWSDIARFLSTDRPVKNLLVTGHSLGGALAVLCARRALHELGIAADAVYTFGQPRTGNALFADDFNGVLGERTYRLVHGQDIVPTVPPPTRGFVHVGRFFACERHGRFDANRLSATPSDEPPFAAQLLDGLKVGLRQLLSGSLDPKIRPDPVGLASRALPPPIGDHLPDRYWRALSPH
jgi:triacylglycerol lipase